MSDLATSCEYHTPEAACLAIVENSKAKANRQLRCLNDQKQSCCYICDQRCECTISCKYLGSTENQPTPQEAPQPQPEKPSLEPKQASINTAKNAPVSYCTSCNVEMTPKHARLKIEDGDSAQPKQFGEYTPQTEESLSVVIYLCPLCGRIEFRAAK